MKCFVIEARGRPGRAPANRGEWSYVRGFRGAGAGSIHRVTDVEDARRFLLNAYDLRNASVFERYLTARLYEHRRVYLVRCEHCGVEHWSRWTALGPDGARLLCDECGSTLAYRRSSPVE